MTTFTQPANGAVRRGQLRDLVRRWAAAAIGPARWLKARIADLGAAGQLGPDRETEVGRWTGARI